MFESPRLRRVFGSWNRFREHVRMPVSGLIAVAAGVVALVGTLVILSAVSEDVTRHNGLSSTDPARLRWFIDHRRHALVTTARYLSQSVAQSRWRCS